MSERRPRITARGLAGNEMFQPGAADRLPVNGRGSRRPAALPRGRRPRRAEPACGSAGQLDPASRRSSGEIGAASPQNSVTTTNSAPKSSVIGCAALSLRDVEDLLAERGIAVSYETIRRWAAGAEIYEAQPAGERCVGEHSVTWNAPLHAWLLLYACTPRTVEARFAPEPWGPWSPPIIMRSAVQEPTVVCTLIQGAAGCPGLQNYWTLPTGTPWPGAFYAPFVIDRFTQDATPPGPGQPKRATIYWLLSTWNPYVVVVMQSTLELN